MTRALLVALALLGATTAQADRGAFTLDVGGGGTLQRVPAPFTSGGASTLGFAPSVQLHARFALTNMFEVGASGFFEVPGTYFHNGVVVEQSGGVYPGTLRHAYHRYGALVGARAVFGMVWGPYVQLEVGWAHRSYDGLTAIDDTNPSYPQDYFLGLGSLVRDNLVGAATVGIQWTGDNFVVALAPRFDFVVGRDSTFNFTLPLTVGWAFYP